MALFLIAGHGGGDSGAIAVDGKTEARLTAELVKMISRELDGYEVLHGVYNRDMNLHDDLEYVRKHATAEDTVIDFHFNAFRTPAAHGTEVFYTKSDSTPPLQLAQNLIAAVQKSTGFYNRGVKPESNSQHAQLAMLRTPAGDELLLEVCFITNPDDYAIYQDNKKQITKDIAACFIQAGLVKKKPKAPKTQDVED